MYLNEAHFIEHIHRYYGILNDEKYQWISPSIAIGAYKFT